MQAATQQMIVSKELAQSEMLSSKISSSLLKFLQQILPHIGERPEAGETFLISILGLLSAFIDSNTVTQTALHKQITYELMYGFIS